MKPSVYIETTIPSFYHEVGTEPEMIARRDWTRVWWDNHRSRYDVFTSEAVIEELEIGTFPSKDNALALVESLPLLAINEAIADAAAVYIAHYVMPADPVGDVLYLAIASFHKCDFLLTWNCQHLANANKFGHIRRINTLLDFFVPIIVTPLELLGETTAL
jgi:hypothetical protein